MFGRLSGLLLLWAALTLPAEHLRAAPLEETCRTAFHAATGDPGGMSLSVEGAAPNIRLTAVSGADRMAVTCTLCSADEINTTAALLGTSFSARLNNTPLAKLSVPPILSGVTLYVDGMRIPGGIAEVPLHVGPHLIALSDGRDSIFTMEKFDAGSMTRISPADFDPGLTLRPLNRAAIISSILGVGITVAGIALVTLDGSCGEEQDGTCESNHNTLPAGVVLISTGAAAVVTGISLAITAAIKKRRISRWTAEAGVP